MSKNDQSEGGIDPKTSKKEKNEDDDDEDEEEDEYEDNHGSKVVATLCRKVPKDKEKENLVIAVVVSSKGDRHVAQACATAHITKLKRRFNEENSSVQKCKIIAGMNQKESKDDTDSSETVGGLKKEEGSAVKGNGTEEGEDGDEDGDEDDDEDGYKQPDPGQEEIKIRYDPSEFMNSVYKSQVNYPLYGGGKPTKALVKRYLGENADALKKLDRKTTWIIPHSSVTTREATAIDDYFIVNKGGDKTVVVVLSAFFFLPKPPSTTPVQKQQKTDGNKYKADPHILVCSIPAPGKDNADDPSYYDDAFNQVKAFIGHYNEEVVSKKKGVPKIERIAISYPQALYKKLLDSKTQKKKVEAKKATTTKKALPKKAPEKSTGKASTQKAMKKQPDYHPHYLNDNSSEDGTDTDSDDGTANDDEDSVLNDVWFKALEKNLLGFSLILMCDARPWQAPPPVKKYFKDEKTVTAKFPDCIDINNSGKQEDEDEDDEDRVDTINIGDVPGTLFICDRQVGKRVGNDNEQSTTGGAFGSWVPMHYTAVMVNTELYSNASEINELIDVIYVKNQKQ
jgi:hypothetical protein